MSDAPLPPPRWRQGLSFRLLMITLGVTLIIEAFIYLPGIASYRNAWLGERLSQARTIAALIERSPPDSLPPAVIAEVLEGAGVSTIALRIDNTRRLVASTETPKMVAYEIDLREPNIARDVMGTFDVLLRGNGRTLRVIGPPPRGGDFVEIVLEEAPLHAALARFSWMILRDSLAISLMSALAVYLALNGLIVAPVRRLSGAVRQFRENPESAATLIKESRRTDEIGHLETGMAQMQITLRSELRQREHLAQLGLAVAKINHDLRNMLSSAQLLADRLHATPDPGVQRFLPRLTDALDRAIRFCQSALAYGRAEERAARLEALELAPFAQELGAQMLLDASSTPALRCEIPAGIMVRADEEHLNRVITNLIRNARAALEGAPDTLSPEIRIMARPTAAGEGAPIEIAVEDNGPGVPPAVREKLFQAFAGTASRGGVGLGLAIAQELMRDMGGNIRLDPDFSAGTRFLLTLPQA